MTNQNEPVLFPTEKIDHFADQMMFGVFYLIENKWIKSIYEGYKNIYKESLYKLIPYINELDTDRHKRLYLELIGFALNVIYHCALSVFCIRKRHFILLKKELDKEGIYYFSEKIISIIENKIRENRMDQVREIVVTNLKPKIKFGFNNAYINFIKREREYSDVKYGPPENRGKEIEIFGKHIGMALDAENYPMWAILGGQYALEIIEDIKELTKVVMIKQKDITC